MQCLCLLAYISECGHRRKAAPPGFLKKTVTCQMTHAQVLASSSGCFNHGKGIYFIKLIACESYTKGEQWLTDLCGLFWTRI